MIFVETLKKRGIDMPAIMKALVDARGRVLGFCTREDAERFKAFVNVYMNDSGAGNGYSAYWIYGDEKIITVDQFPDDTVLSLEEGIVRSMMWDILSARRAQVEIEMNVPYFAGGGPDGVIFRVDELPPRLRPTTNDMFRIPKNLLYEHAYKMSGGRVVEDCGQTLLVANYGDCLHIGEYKKGAVFVEIPVDHTMKIDDFLARNSPDKHG